MDLIAQLINNKKNVEDVEQSLVAILDEIIKYEKLSKSPKFTHITESPLLQKQLPNIWQAFNKNSQKMFLFENAVSIVSELSTNQLQIVVDYREHFTKREKRQMEIIGNPANISFKYYELDMFPHTRDLEEDYIVLSEEIQTGKRVSIIIHEKQTFKVYTGNVSNDVQERTKISQIKPFSTKIDGVEIVIPTYSVQGNNDYDFGTIADQPISFPTEDTFKWGTKTITLSMDEEFQKSLVGTKADKLAEFLYSLYLRCQTEA